MKTITAKLSHTKNRILVLIVAAGAAALTTAANAQSYLYTFTGTGSAGGYAPNFIDGSTLTISGGAITTYDFTAIGFGNFGTPATTTVVAENVSSYGPAGWTGELDLTYQTIDMEITGASFTSMALGASIQGTWTAEAVPEPSAASLLGATAVGLAAWRPWRRRLTQVQ